MSPSPGHEHHALFYDSTDTLVESAVPFLRAGLEVGDVPVLVCRERGNAVLTEALGPGTPAVVLAPTDVYRRTVDAVGIYQSMVHELRADGAHRVRLVAEVDFGAPDMWAEWARFEAILNLALEPYPLSSVCCYDTRALPWPLLDVARRTHPRLLNAIGDGPNDGYQEPAAALRSIGPDPPDQLEATTPLIELTLREARQLVETRRALRNALTGAGVPVQQAEELLVAVTEVCTNGLVHGRPPVVVLAWVGLGRMLFAITDKGDGYDDPLTGYLTPRDGSAGGYGLWLARSAVDRLTAARTAEGFTVRLGSAVRNGTT